MRTVEHREGLALLGAGEVGGLPTVLPTLLWSAGRLPSPPLPSASLRLVSAPSEPGPLARHATVEGAGASTAFVFPVHAPESSARPGAIAPVGSDFWFLHWPIEPAEWDRLREARPKGIVLGNARTLFAEGEPFVRAIGELRRRLGAAPLLWAPRTALPHRIAFLVYAGVDLLDSTAGLWAAAEGTYLDPDQGTVEGAEFRAERACRCVGCIEANPDLPSHAIEMYALELARVRAAVRTGRLRELVEGRMTAEPLLAELLRYSDEHLGDLLEERAPVTASRTSNYVLRDAFRRPEAARFRRRLLERYAPPPSKQVLLLVPCSKTKPYRNSPSHRRIHQALRELPNLARLHTVSITSPLGVVPRELEDTPPANAYDIPVTGAWDEAERGAVNSALRHLFATGRYRSALVHLDPAEYDFIRPVLPSELPVTWTAPGASGGSRGALAGLREEAARQLEALEPVEGGPLRVVREELAAVAAVQFGPPAAEALFRPTVRVHGRPWFQRLVDGTGTDLAIWKEDRGLFHLTVAGGTRVLGTCPLTVVVDPQVRLGGDLFTPGIVSADRSIRTGDAVLLTQEGRLVGVGEAELPGPLMTELPRGLAVRVRHRAHAPPAAAPTAT